MNGEEVITVTGNGMQQSFLVFAIIAAALIALNVLVSVFLQLHPLGEFKFLKKRREKKEEDD